jgi:hypothetical protein
MPDQLIDRDETGEPATGAQHSRAHREAPFPLRLHLGPRYEAEDILFGPSQGSRGGTGVEPIFRTSYC